MIVRFNAAYNKHVNLLINPVFIAPFTLLGLMLTPLLPKNRSLYLNSVIFARKVYDTR